MQVCHRTHISHLPGVEAASQSRAARRSGRLRAPVCDETRCAHVRRRVIPDRTESIVHGLRMARRPEENPSQVDRDGTARRLPLHRHADQTGVVPRGHQQSAQQVSVLWTGFELATRHCKALCKWSSDELSARKIILVLIFYY